MTSQPNKETPAQRKARIEAEQGKRRVSKSWGKKDENHKQNRKKTKKQLDKERDDYIKDLPSTD